MSDWDGEPVRTNRADVGCVGFMNLFINELSFSL